MYFSSFYFYTSSDIIILAPNCFAIFVYDLLLGAWNFSKYVVF